MATVPPPLASGHPTEAEVPLNPVVVGRTATAAVIVAADAKAKFPTAVT